MDVAVRQVTDIIGKEFHMKIGSIGNSTVSEVHDSDVKEEAKKVTPEFQVQPIVKERAEDSNDESDRQHQKQRMDNLIDFVARARKKQAKLQGKKRLRAIRAYESLRDFEEDFIYKGRFSRIA